MYAYIIFQINHKTAPLTNRGAECSALRPLAGQGLVAHCQSRPREGSCPQRPPWWLGYDHRLGVPPEVALGDWNPELVCDLEPTAELRGPRVPAGTQGRLHKGLCMFLCAWALVTRQAVPKRTMDSDFLFLASRQRVFSTLALFVAFSLPSTPFQRDFSAVPSGTPEQPCSTEAHEVPWFHQFPFQIWSRKKQNQKPQWNSRGVIF